MKFFLDLQRSVSLRLTSKALLPIRLCSGGGEKGWMGLEQVEERVLWLSVYRRVLSLQDFFSAAFFGKGTREADTFSRF